MKLIDVINRLENADEKLIIFQDNQEDFNSDILLIFGEEGDQGIKEKDGKTYYYLIEVFLAKEFIKDWIANLDYSPSTNETARRLYDYALNDA